MPWWGWILIALAIGIINYLKLTVWTSMKKKKPSQSNKDED